MARLDDKLAALATMSLAQLRGEWLLTFGTAAPRTVGAGMLALGIAHRLQEKMFGGLAPTRARELDKLTEQLARTGELTNEPTAHLKPGTRLVRDWRGTTHQVELLESGYRYRDEQYRSLSEIAHKITGAKWSGPRFFGLTRRSSRSEPA